MTPERWQQVEDLFVQAIEMPDAERAHFLDGACGGDEELLQEVASLLASDDPDAPLVDHPFLNANAAVADEEVDRLIGPYRVVRLLGRGGMGAVYLAIRDDDVFKKEVAIKLLKRGMDTDSMLSRFRTERQILANLEHPFIARLIDGGATGDGLPYFVMEYVDGLPITKYCAERSLDVKARLNLFRLVCEAVQYAHRNLVVHRDLKPGNILITQEGVPKLLDFGIAKVVGRDSGEEAVTLTRPEQRMLTPDYASPEQVLGLPNSTSTDIYALGAILYELLTQQRAHQFTSQSSAELQRVICEVEPDRPSQAALRCGVPRRARKTLRRELAGDLDNIVLTALRKDPQRRYPSAAAFSDDIRRHLEGLPVTAQEDRWSYRAGKFVRRHHWGMLAASLIAATLIGGIATTTYQARRAERRFALVRDLANTLLYDLSNQVRMLPGSTPVRNAMIQTVVRYLDALAQDSGRDPELDLEVATAYYYVGGVEGNPGQSNLGQTTAAAEHYDKATRLLEPLIKLDQTKGRAVDTLIRIHLELNRIDAALGDPDGADGHLNRGVEIAEQAAADGVQISLPARVNLYNLIARARSDRGLVAEEQVYARKALDLGLEWVASDRSTPVLDFLRSVYISMGDSLSHGGDILAASENYEKALEISEEVSQRGDANFNQKFAPAAIHHLYGDILGATDDPNVGDFAGALVHYREAARINEEMLAADPLDVNARRNLSGSYRRVGMMLLARDAAESLHTYHKATELSQEVLVGNEENLQYLNALASSLFGEGAALHHLGRNREALDVLDRAIEIQKKIEETDPTLVFLLRITSRAYMVKGDTVLSMGDLTGAREAYHEGLDAADRVLRQAPTSLFHMIDRADLLEATGRYYLETASRAAPGQRAAVRRSAAPWFEQSLSIWNDWIQRHQAVPYAERRKAAVEAELNRLNTP